MFDRLTARLEQWLRSVRPGTRADAIALRTALIEAKVAARALQAALADTERELAAERRQLLDTERRGRQAAQVPDPETVALAERFALRHRERVALLERKLVVQREEVALAARELEESTVQFRAARSHDGSESLAAAWRGLHAAGAPGGSAADSALDAEAESLAAKADQRLRDRAVEAQLAYLKNKLGQNPAPPPK